MINRIRILCLALCLSLIGPASAHEFWIEPAQMQVEIGDEVEARFRNGDDFDGVEYAYFGRQSDRLQIVRPDGREDLTPRDGDRPAIVTVARAPGLTILVHETKHSFLKYKTWEKFETFAKNKDFEGVKDIHRQRGLPNSNFRESYTRHTKALLAVGGGQGQDQNLGLKTEFVALDNPYTTHGAGAIRVQLFYAQVPRRDVQVEVFERAGGVVTETKLRTDDQGIVQVPVRPGADYLLNAVVLRVPASVIKDEVWETLWASLTFAVPVQ